jgi:hypothetical protein
MTDVQVATEPFKGMYKNMKKEENQSQIISFFKKPSVHPSVMH